MKFKDYAKYSLKKWSELKGNYIIHDYYGKGEIVNVIYGDIDIFLQTNFSESMKNMTISGLGKKYYLERSKHEKRIFDDLEKEVIFRTIDDKNNYLIYKEVIDSNKFGDGYKINKDIIVDRVNRLKKDFNFNGLFHFTDFSNLDNILNEGYLYSRDYCEYNNIKFIDGANHSVLERANEYISECVRFYYRTKTPTLYNNEGIKIEKYSEFTHIPIPVYLLFDEELIYLDNTIFSDGNATNSRIGGSSDFFNNMDWKSIFHDSYINEDEKKYIINKRQSELLSINPVSLKYLKKVIFRCEADRKRAINKWGENNIFSVDKRIYSDKNFKDNCNGNDMNNFIENYSINLTHDEKCTNEILIRYDFNKKWEDYKRKIEILDLNDKEVINYNIIEEYLGLDGFILKESKYQNETIIARIKGNVDEWKKINIYVNGILSVEDYIIKYNIEKCDIITNNNNSLKINIKFINSNYRQHIHKCEIIDRERNILLKGKICVSKNNDKNELEIKYSNIRSNWFKFKYYIDDILCYSKIIN